MNSPAPEPPSGLLFRCMCRITGTDLDLLATCPQRDRDHVATIAVIQLTVFAWQTLVIAVAAHAMLAEPGRIRLELIGIAVLLAAIIALIDSYMIIRSSWYLHGMEELRRAGLVMPGSLTARLQNAAFLAIRFAMASAASYLFAGVIAILVFPKDVDRRLDIFYQLANAPVIETAEHEYDWTTRTVASARSALETQLAKDAEIAGQTSLVAPDQERLKEAATHVAELEHGRSVAEGDLRDAQAFATDELGGFRHNARNSGIPGRGPRRLAAEERRQQSAERLSSMDKDLAVGRKRLDNLRQSAAAQTRQLSELAAPRLAGIETARRQHAQELAALDAKLVERQEARSAAIQAAVEQNPAYRPREAGLLARARALGMVAAENPWAKSLIIALGVFFFIVELAAVVAKSFTFVPSAYATLLAQQECERARKISHRIAEAFNLLTEERQTIGPAHNMPLHSGSARDDVGPNTSGADTSDTKEDQTPTPQSRPRGRPPRQQKPLTNGSQPNDDPPPTPPRRDDSLFGEDT